MRLGSAAQMGAKGVQCQELLLLLRREVGTGCGLGVVGGQKGEVRSREKP